LLGGAWILPPVRPVCLRPLLLREEYKNMAVELNNRVSWQGAWGLEIFIFCFVSLISPSFAAITMVSFQTLCFLEFLTVIRLEIL
jgi:hypothetical protein